MRQYRSTLWGAALGAVLLPTGVVAEKPTPYPDFTFKRVTVAGSGSGPRINVQVTPEDEARQRGVSLARSEEAAPEASSTAKAAPGSGFEWFWEEISPALSDSGPGRLDLALRHMKNGPAVSTPRLDLLGGVLRDHQADILLATIGTKVSPALALAVISVESSGRADAVSSAGATGLMQLMPDTAARFGVEDSTEPAQNIKGGVAYLDWLMQEFSGDPILVLAAYNSGEGNVRRHDGVPPFAETRGYVPKVLAAWTVARALCKTPPELISDGCAFDLRGG